MVSTSYSQAGWSRPISPNTCSARLEVFTMNGLDCRPSKRFRWTPPQEKWTATKQYSRGMPAPLFMVTTHKSATSAPRRTTPRKKARGYRRTRGCATSDRQPRNDSPSHVVYPSKLAVPTLHRYNTEYPVKRAKQEKNEPSTLDDWMSTLFCALDRVPRTAGAAGRPCGIAYLVRRTS